MYVGYTNMLLYLYKCIHIVTCPHMYMYMYMHNCSRNEHVPIFFSTYLSSQSRLPLPRSHDVPLPS